MRRRDALRRRHGINLSIRVTKMPVACKALSAAIVRWVEAAKRESTREKRISLCVRRMPERADRAKKHPAIIPDEAANLS